MQVYTSRMENKTNNLDEAVKAFMEVIKNADDPSKVENIQNELTNLTIRANNKKQTLVTMKRHRELSNQEKDPKK